jgi:ferric-dicitrate binding protein FerR (iron transport regulator)
MSDRQDPQGQQDQQDQDLRRLIRRAGLRPRLPEAAADKLRTVAETAWQAKVMERRRRRSRARLVRWGTVAALAAAAALLLTLNPGLWRTLSPSTVDGASEGPMQIATLLHTQGGVVLDGSDPEKDGVPTPIPVGTVLTTAGDGRAALRLGSGELELRLDHGSRLRLDGVDRVTLEAGALYVDAGEGDESAVSAIRVTTSWGTARDIGTRFEIRLEEQALRLRVRDGVVLLEPAAGETNSAEGAPTVATHRAETHRAEEGTELRLTADGAVQRSPIVPHGEAWDWVVAAAPPFAIEGRTLAEFLARLEREVGWRIHYQTPAVREAAERTILHGSVSGLAPEEAVAVTVAGSALGYQLENGVLTVR